MPVHTAGNGCAYTTANTTIQPHTMKHRSIKLYGFTVLLLCVMLSVQGQDTVRISMPGAEAQFIQTNLSLLAQRYNIDIARAEVIQARLYNNPSLSLSGNLYDPQRKRLLNVSNSNGQYDVAIQQVIRLGGKHNREVQLALTAVSMSEDQFADLLRNLRYVLRSTFYELLYTRRITSGYEKQETYLSNLSKAYDQLQATATVTMKDAVRIKSLLYALRADRSALQQKEEDLQTVLRGLLQSNNSYFIPEITRETRDLLPELSRNDLPELIDTAYASRHDLKQAEQSIRYNEQNYRLQKALAKPDLTLGAEFDKRGSFVDNASFLTVGIDLPFFKRNQGNIKAAQFSIAQSQVLATQQKMTVENEVRQAYAKLQSSAAVLRSFDPAFRDQYDRLLEGVTDNFKKKNISLVEFTDFYESYRDNLAQVNQLDNQCRQAMESLQLAVGKPLFNQ
jgi:cobalt-zinc-cadmium efflux system outer membrane protein